MKIILRALFALSAFLVNCPPALADQSGRPDDMSLESFQFGPANRWTFSHMREVLPTANIARDPDRFRKLERSESATDEFSVTFRERDQTIDEIADHQYIDGLLLLKDGEIVFEKYYGHLAEDRSHLMNSISKSVASCWKHSLQQRSI